MPPQATSTPSPWRSGRGMVGGPSSGCSITTPEAVRQLLHDGGAQGVDVAAEECYQVLRTPEDFWTIALGNGLRWTIDQMGTTLVREVKHEVLDRLAAKWAKRIETNVIYAIAAKPSGPT